MIARTGQDWERTLEATSLPSLILDENNVIRVVNDAAQQYFRVSARELVGRKCHEFFRFTRESRGGCFCLRAMESGRPSVCETQAEAGGKNFLLSCLPVFDEEGKIERFVLSASDLSGRRSAMGVLAEHRDLAELYLDAVGVIVVALNADGTVALINQKGCELLQCPETEILGRNWFDRVLPERSREHARELFEKWMAGESEPLKYHENSVRTRGERERIISWHITVVRNAGGGAAGILASGEDVTERREVEAELIEHAARLEASNKELESFAYSVAHDLRGPLRSIEGFSEILLRKAAPRLGAEDREHLLRICAAADRMGAIIDDLLDLSRITRREMTKRAVDLGAVAKAVAKDLRSAEPGRQVDFSVGEALTARADEGLARILLQSLLENAWKFTARRERADIEFAQTRADGELVFFVRDNGVGFDMAHAEMLFRPFQRLHRAEEFPGTGIGLATAQRIVQRHGGRIWAAAEAGKGATFFFTLG
jgi:PAS domain S-box-containing protein